MSKADRIERIVIFADGTGNAFSKQESNIWRLYQALDLAAPEQVALYIEGVGTSSFRPFALLDGATGIGVPSNVRKLYRFLCWNWRPGVEIYLFGFSRGAFAIRTLIGMIASQGLVPTEFDGDTVSRAEMRRNAMVAWRSYRARTVAHVKFTVKTTRWVRDRLLAVWGRVRGFPTPAGIAAATKKLGRDEIPIRFAGLFDTVEAYGVPFEELRLAIDRAIWPISFRNRVLSPGVDLARHALALDEERTTFHPVRFDVSREPAGSTRIREVWFAGVHADVGGGYPDDYLSYLPLSWMMAEVAAASDGRLRFKPGALDAIRASASPLAAIHDSRSGLHAFYRYGPRKLAIDKAGGGPPVIHHSVAEKMVFGTENYAPLTLPDKARVLMPDGSLHGIAGFQAAVFKALRAGILPQPPPLDAASQAVQRLSKPNAAFVDLTRDMIWWRTVCYFILLAAAFVTVCLPVTAPWLDGVITEALVSGADHLGFGAIGAEWQQRLTNAQGGLASNLGDLSSSVGGFVPDYAKGWVQALVAQPLASLIIIAATLSLYRLSGSLRDGIADLARCAWFSQGSARNAARHRSVATWIARGIRTSRRVDGFARIVWDKVIPGGVLAIFGLCALVLVNKTVVTYRSGSESLCRSDEKAPKLQSHGDPQTSPALFRTDAPCWATGLLVEKGRSYRLWLEMADPYLDGSDVVDIAGFATESWRHRLAYPILRWWSANWFQPIARIGSTGTTEWPLVSLSGITGSATGKTEAIKSPWPDPLKPPPRMDPGEIAGLQRKLGIHKGFVSQFIAQGSGELFLFVNDALVEIPFGPELDWFYGNNSGTARVTLQLLADPPVPTAAR